MANTTILFIAEGGMVLIALVFYRLATRRGDAKKTQKLTRKSRQEVVKK